MPAMGMQQEYGTVDYSAFVPPPVTMDPGEPVQMPTTVAPEPAVESKLKEASDYGSDFQIPHIDPSQFQEEEDDGNFFNSFNYTNNFNTDEIANAMTSSTSKEVLPKHPGSREVSKFDFCNDTTDNVSVDENDLVNQMSSLKVSSDLLSDKLDQLELTSKTQDSIEKFSQAKFLIEMGNIDKGNEILNGMMATKEINLKQSESLDHQIMNTFDPISE